MNIIINPGTENQNNTTQGNADVCIKNFIEDTGLKGLKSKLISSNDRGWYDYEIIKGKFKLSVSVPGINPEIVRKGVPFESPRIYVDGSSWLWGYGLGIFIDRYKDFLLEEEKG